MKVIWDREKYEYYAIEKIGNQTLRMGLSQDEVEKIQRKKITSDNVDQVLEHLLSNFRW